MLINTANRNTSILLVLCAMLVGSMVAAPGSAWAQYGAENGEWRSHGGDLGGTKYSPLDQIDATNFSDLRLAWRWKSADGSLDLEGPRETSPGIGIGMFQATPLMVGGTLYLSTALQQVAAVDAASGETIWVHDPEVYLKAVPAHFYNSRGVAYWEDGDDARIFFGTHEGYLLALDAATGEPVPDFGQNGRVDLMEGIPRAGRGTTNSFGRSRFGVASPPIVARDVIVTPTVISDSTIKKEAPPGWVKGIDARTGDTRWVFRTVPQADDFGSDTWLDESWRYSGNTNVWSMFSVDDELGYVYLPTGTPTGDYYGGHRLGDNLFAESLGRPRHRDRPAHVALSGGASRCLGLRFSGRAKSTGHYGRRTSDKGRGPGQQAGFTYVFDRETGDPVWPIEERPVPTDTDLEGEVLSPTQPFPTKPPPFEYQGVTTDDLVDFTPEIRAMAVGATKNFRLGPLFSPPMLRHDGGLQGTIQRPHIGGGASWTGAAVDPETGLLYVPSENRYTVVTYSTPDPDKGGNLRYTIGGWFGGIGASMPRGLPLLKPPYSRMTAIDLNRGDHAWMEPKWRRGPPTEPSFAAATSTCPRWVAKGMVGRCSPRPLLISALSAGGTDGGPRLVARDKATGQIVGSVDLPSGAIGTPMTYMHQGTQYIALTVGGEVPELVGSGAPLTQRLWAILTKSRRAPSRGAPHLIRNQGGRYRCKSLCWQSQLQHNAGGTRNACSPRSATSLKSSYPSTAPRASRAGSPSSSSATRRSFRKRYLGSTAPSCRVAC